MDASRIKIIYFLLLALVFFLGCQSVPASKDNRPAPIINLNLSDDLSKMESPFSSLITKALAKEVPPLNLYENQTHFLKLLNTGEDAFLLRLHLIRKAKHSINIQTYIWRNDESGQFMIQELIEAAKRGVKVKVNIDKMGSFDEPRLMAYFQDAHPNIEIKFYNPSSKTLVPSVLAVAEEILLAFKKFNHRMHNKTFIVDDRIAIIGGRNVGNEYYDLNLGINFKDREVVIIGPIVQTITLSFAKFWSHELSFKATDFVDIGEILKEKSYAKYTKKEDPAIMSQIQRYINQAGDNTLIQERFVKDTIKVKKLMFLSDNPGKNFSSGLKGFGKTSAHLAELMQSAQKSLLIQSPYFVLDKETFKAARRLRRRNKNIMITVSTNSLAATDSIYTYAYTFKRKEQYIQKLKLNYFELKPLPIDMNLLLPNYDYLRKVLNVKTMSKIKDQGKLLSFYNKNPHLCLHAKSFIIDEEIGWVGSFNLDPRSIHINAELGLTVWDKVFAQKLKEDIELLTAPQNSWVVGFKKPRAVLTTVSRALHNVLDILPIIDLWPFSRISLYELKEGHKPVSLFDPRFYDHYRPVGPFPEVELDIKEIQLRFIKSLMLYAEPIM